MAFKFLRVFAQVVHCDLALRNLLIDGEGTVRSNETDNRLFGSYLVQLLILVWLKVHLRKSKKGQTLALGKHHQFKSWHLFDESIYRTAPEGMNVK